MKLAATAIGYDSRDIAHFHSTCFEKLVKPYATQQQCAS